MRQVAMPDDERRICPWCKSGSLVYIAEQPRADTYACRSCGKAVWWRGYEKKVRKIWYLRYPGVIKER
jgi:hypothetical protein